VDQQDERKAHVGLPVHRQREVADQIEAIARANGHRSGAGERDMLDPWPGREQASQCAVVAIEQPRGGGNIVAIGLDRPPAIVQTAAGNHEFAEIGGDEPFEVDADRFTDRRERVARPGIAHGNRPIGFTVGKIAFDVGIGLFREHPCRSTRERQRDKCGGVAVATVDHEHRCAIARKACDAGGAGIVRIEAEP